MGITDILKGFEPELEDIKKHLNEAVEEQTEDNMIRSLIFEATGNTGKMLRPLLMLLVAGDYDPNKREELISSAAALEMLHNSTLILDDMIDSSPLRRGLPTIWKKYGLAPALYAGDYLLVATYSYLCGRGFYSSAQELMRAGLAACNGETTQFVNLHNTEAEIGSYISAIKGKTAFLFKTACVMACRITEKPEPVSSLIIEFGETLGTMFQIRDDLLDWTKDSSEIGKPANEDFAEGIYTLPAIYTFSRPGFAERLKKLAGSEKLSPDDLNEAREIVHEAGGIDYAENYLRDLSEKAICILMKLPAGQYRERLIGVVKLVTGENK